MTEVEALRVIDAVKKQFGWAVKVLTREDADLAVGRILSDGEWGRVSSSAEWQELMFSGMTEADGATIRGVVNGILDFMPVRLVAV